MAGGDRSARCGVILAGGDGLRLRPLTQRIAGDGRPKQFCRVLGTETLLDQTRRRVALAVPPERTVVVVTQPHRRFYAPLLLEAPSGGAVVVQPENAGTAPAILYGLLRVAAMAPRAPVAVFPSDHYVSDDAVFMAHVESAFEAIRVRPDLVILLGVRPNSPESEYGWIEAGDPIAIEQPSSLSRVRRFWEKPPAALASALWAGGCLWNSFVMAAGVPALLALIRSVTPDLYDAFAPLRFLLGTPAEEGAAQVLYARIPSMDFSREVLASHPANLAVLPVSGVRWSDLGDPRRVLATLSDAGIQPDWAEPAVAMPAWAC